MRKWTLTLAIGSFLVPLVWCVQAGGASTNSSHTDGASAPMCSLRNLSVAVVGGSAASNQEAMLLRFRNKGRTSCTLYGYPKVVAVRPGAFSSAKDRVNIYNGGWTGTQLPVVLVQRGQSASAVVGGASVTLQGQSTTCYHERFKTVHVSVPGSSRLVTFSAALPNEGLYLPSCAGVWVTPFVPGVGWFLPQTSTTTTLSPLIPAPVPTNQSAEGDAQLACNECSHFLTLFPTYLHNPGQAVRAVEAWFSEAAAADRGKATYRQLATDLSTFLTEVGDSAKWAQNGKPTDSQFTAIETKCGTLRGKGLVN
jgi:hypothetical protein